MNEMDREAAAANRFNELPEATQKFLSQLDDRDIATLAQGIELVRSTLTVGRFFKWLIISVVGIFVGIVMLWESIQKFAALWRQH